MATTKKARPPGATSEPVDRLENAVAAAQDAAKDLRKDLSRGRRQMVDDLEKTLKDARANVRRTRRTLVADLEEVGRSIRGQDGARTGSEARWGRGRMRGEEGAAAVGP